MTKKMLLLLEGDVAGKVYQGQHPSMTVNETAALHDALQAKQQNWADVCDVMAFGEHAKEACHVAMTFPMDHYYLADHADMPADQISLALAKWIKQGAYDIIMLDANARSGYYAAMLAAYLDYPVYQSMGWFDAGQAWQLKALGAMGCQQILTADRAVLASLWRKIDSPDPLIKDLYHACDQAAETIELTSFLSSQEVNDAFEMMDKAKDFASKKVNFIHCAETFYASISYLRGL
jgi:hypothetical protein